MLNRLLHGIIAESWRLCAAGVVSVKDCELVGGDALIEGE